MEHMWSNPSFAQHLNPPHCKDTIPNIRNKYTQKRNCVASVPISTFLCLWSGIHILTLGLPILLQENMWTNPGKIKITHRHMNVEMNVGLRLSNCFLGIHEWDFRSSAHEPHHVQYGPFASPVPT